MLYPFLPATGWEFATEDDILSRIKWIAMQINRSLLFLANFQKQNNVSMDWKLCGVFYSLSDGFHLLIATAYDLDKCMHFILWWIKVLCHFLHSLPHWLSCKHGTLFRSAAECKRTCGSMKIHNHDYKMIQTEYIMVSRSLYYFGQCHLWYPTW